jgi:malonyl-CoA/methylmalonyl-CoA synthetase
MPIPLVERVRSFGNDLAILAIDGRASFADLLESSERIARHLLAGEQDLAGRTVAFLIPPGRSHVEVQWGIWRAGGIAVPLCLSHPEPELAYVIEDSDAEILIASPELVSKLHPIAQRQGCRLLSVAELSVAREGDLPEIEADRSAMIVYTSGTTGGPKGVVTTHQNIQAQIESLVIAWEWSGNDRVLLVLPLHHVHGIINVVGCALWSGATCDMMTRFDPAAVWQRIADRHLTLFMAVPTIYSRLASTWEATDTSTRRAWSSACDSLRLMVSGSAALPTRLFDRWQEITGHTLLERYGMTEIGMALSNPLHGERIPGHVGQPLPGVEVRRVDLQGSSVAPDKPAEIEVRGPGVFSRYWQRPDETRRSFREDWFRTGDLAVVEDGSYRILGRQSVDIIKTGGYKISALEIEETLRRHPDIADCAVVGIPDSEWGERVAAAVRLQGDTELTLEALRLWAKERLAPYKAPSRLLVLDDLPRNPMGKVVKPDLKRLFATES